MWRRLVVVGLVGCGRVGFDVGVVDGTAPADAIDVAPVDAPFNAPQLVAELATGADEDDPSLTDDLLEMYFDANPGLVRVTRTAPDQPWSSRTFVSELTEGGNVNNAKISGDGLAMYFASSRAPSMANDLWFATRPDRASAFSAPALVPGLQTADDDFEPMIVGNGTVIYFTRTNVVASFWRADRASTSVAFANVQPVPSLDSAGYDGSLWISADERVVYFHSDRVSSAERMIYRATRTSASDPFGTPVAVTEIDLPGKLEDPWLSPDGHTLYFSSNTSGQYEIYRATR